MRNGYKTLARKFEAKIPLLRKRCRYEDNIKMDIQELWVRRWTGLFGSRYGPVADSCGNGSELSGSIKGLKFLYEMNDRRSRRTLFRRSKWFQVLVHTCTMGHTYHVTFLIKVHLTQSHSKHCSDVTSVLLYT
jgi:hypothetical protein